MRDDWLLEVARFGALSAEFPESGILAARFRALKRREVSSKSSVAADSNFELLTG